MGNDIAVLPEKDRWKVVKNINMDSFDFTWRPDPRELPFTYVFGNELYDAVKMPTVIYSTLDGDEIKYVDEFKAKLGSSKHLYEHLENAELNDYTWIPDPDSPPYIYVWGNQWNDPRDKISIQYKVEGATEYKYMEERTTRLPDKTNFEVLAKISNFDFSWEPSPASPPYIYVFGNQWFSAEKEPTVEYHVLGATAKKYVDTIVATLDINMTNWEVPSNIDQSKFDFSWHPDPDSPPYIYEFATVWNNRGGPRYVVPEATEFKYIEDIKAKLVPNRDNWEVPSNIDQSKFDFSWVPHPQSPPYVYQFSTKVDDIWLDDGPRYITPKNNGEIVRLENSILYTGEVSYPRYVIETTLDELINKHTDESFWALNKSINYDNFDFSWKPSKDQLFGVNVFGSPESEITQTYFVNAQYYLKGYTGFNYLEADKKLDEVYLAELFVKPDMFYVDRSNAGSQEQFDALKIRFPNIQKTRYLNSWADTINRCINRATTELIWILNSELDYADFDFEYYPNPWQMKMVHVFGTQWSHWGTTFMVNCETFTNDTKYIKIVEHLSNLNFVKKIRAKATTCVYDIVVIDHGNPETTQVVQTIAKSRTPNIVKYDESYFNTIKKIMDSLPIKKEHYLWICSSVCDYSTFDFSYICDPFARDNLHVFPSEKQKFGDTFLIDVNSIRNVFSSIDSMNSYHKINFNQHQRLTRLPEPIIFSDDTHVSSMSETFEFPYATFVTSDNKDIDIDEHEPMSLWASDTKNIVITSTGGSRIIVPNEAKAYVKKELYDYPYIKKSNRLSKSKPIDIVYLSNGETGAEENWEHLLSITKNLPNRVVRVDGVNGRVAAYHAALEASNTPWAFTVFAKLKINPKFDFNWQPDRMQVPKHYIFHAKNPVNGLVYGHQAMIAYNKKLTLANIGKGLDFTLDDEHEVVPLVSGTANYNTDEFSTWRTAFREVLKLNADDSDESRERLDIWLNKAEGNFAQYSIKGAVDADEYYNEVNGDFDKLKLSYEWEWLRKRFTKL
jgi:hypothetical protein